MAKPNVNYPKRIFFPKGAQGKFLEQARTALGNTNMEFAKVVGVTMRSLTDWKREKYSISLRALTRLCKKTKSPLPRGIEIKDPFWYTSLGSRTGGIATYKKYGCVGGNPEYRKKKWYEWWEKEGKFKKHPIINTNLPLHLPKKSSMLAEFIGIVLGDGGITRRQVTITLHNKNDRDYTQYVKRLCEKLFYLVPSVHERRGEAISNIVISRGKLVSFLVETGLAIGSKVRQQIKVPSWIQQNKQYTISCLRGLFDTDGCFYIDTHKYKDKIYYNCAINFTNRSIPILTFFKTSLQHFGFHPTQKTTFSVFLRRENEILEYFKKVGSSNPKHLNKLKHYIQNRYGEVPKWL